MLHIGGTARPQVRFSCISPCLSATDDHDLSGAPARPIGKMGQSPGVSGANLASAKYPSRRQT